MKQVAAMFLKNSNGENLITRRASSESMAGWWEFPGGKIEAGESAEECLVREIKEELNLDITVGKELGQSFYEYEHGAFEIIGLLATCAEAEEILLTVHDDASWIKPEDLTQINEAPICEVDFNANHLRILLATCQTDLVGGANDAYAAIAVEARYTVNL